jgi:hypothetical protein
MAEALCNLCGSPLRAVDGLCPACVARTITSFIQKTAVTDEIPDVPGYEILGVIGRGGMGVVFRALRLADEKHVALKIGSTELFERLTREAETLRALEHPHILKMLDSGLTADGRCFIVTEIACGGDLAKRLQCGPLGENEALRLFRQILAAVGHAHEKGVIHRDLKPANILLDDAGDALVADFSLARPLEAEMALTRSAEVFGTPYYIAPEVRRGAAEADARADIFSLGVLLHEMLTGKLPIGQYEPSRHDRVISRCLRENPERRPRSVSEVRRFIQPGWWFLWPWIAAVIVLVMLSMIRIRIENEPPPWQNSLGMTFVKVPGTNVMVCTHETRIRDFEAYSQAMKLPLTGPETRWRHPPPGFEVTPEHPVTPVSQIMAARFCEWLTKREKKWKYRLPTDAEWSAIAKTLPEQKPAKSGFTQVTAHGGANALGVHDLEGNVSEWTGTDSRPGEFFIRGASFRESADKQSARALQQQDGVGFRVVIEMANPP